MSMLKATTTAGFLCGANPKILSLWKRIMCKRLWHCWSEVVTENGHYYRCNACGLKVRLSRVNYKHAEWLD